MEEQRRLGAPDYPGPEAPEVCQYKDEQVVFDGHKQRLRAGSSLQNRCQVTTETAILCGFETSNILFT